MVFSFHIQNLVNITLIIEKYSIVSKHCYTFIIHFTIPLKLQNIQNMVYYAKDRKISMNG